MNLATVLIDIYTSWNSIKSTSNVFTSSLGINQDFDWIRYDAGLSRSGTANSDLIAVLLNLPKSKSALPGYQ